MSALSPDDWLRAVRRHLIDSLGRFGEGWVDDGELITLPGSTVAIRAAVNHDVGRGHVDLGVHLNLERPDAPVIWDCAAGGGEQDDAAARVACSIWAQATAPAIFELLVQSGELAAHSMGDDDLGLGGWHSLHGPIVGYGHDDASDLENWCLDNPVVPALRDSLAPALSPDFLHGVKFIVGAFGDESIAEVRIDGVRHDACSDALLALPWPKQGRRVARFFVLFVHPDPAALVAGRG